VERVRCALTDAGLRVFLDRRHLASGHCWLRVLEEVLAASFPVITALMGATT
jgi:hypothetical protein